MATEVESRARAPRELVACNDCGCVNVPATETLAGLRAQLAEAREQIEALKGEITVKAVAVKRLRKEQVTQMTLDPLYDEAMEVLSYWRERLRPRTKELNGPRLRAVLDRLQHSYTVEDLKHAVDGYAAMPPVGRNGKVWDDADEIFGKAKHVDEGIRRYESSRPTADVQQRIAQAARAGVVVSWRRVRAANRDLLVRWLRLEFGGGLDDGGGVLAWPCPVCDNHPSCTLRVTPAASTFSWVAECSSCGMGEDRLLPLAAQSMGEEIAA